MVYLYTSNTDPKGVAAQQFLAEKQVPYTEVNIDLESGVPALQRLRGLVGEVFLPTLTEAGEGEAERLVAVGFEPTTWEQWLQQKTV